MFNPALASEKIKKDFVSYLTTSFKTCDLEYNKQFKEKLESEISKGPYVEISDAFKTGLTLSQLIEEGIISNNFIKIEENKPKNYEIDVPLNRALYKHQEIALRKTASGKNIVITTGTGSGKTESFLYPILNELLKEQESNNLTESGVRVILIYPMNALANDQIKRIRNILMFYPDISFGVFTGDTIKSKISALNKYKEAHSNEKYEELRNGLSNECFSREEMYEKPPHILITNYVMLEYLLLRPDYSDVFKNSNLKFIVLDESHVYRGATGIEMSMLLRKLRARLGKAEEGVKYILTSATLGEKGKSEPQIVDFASQLTDEIFNPEDIIFGERVKLVLDEKNQNDVPSIMWGELCSCIDNSETIKSLFTKFKYSYDSNIEIDENIYNLCHGSSIYYNLRKYYSEPVEINKIANILNVSEEVFVCFLFICSKASKNGFPLLDIHYHFFIRALEGAYVTLSGDKKLFLDRINEIDNKDGTKDMVFEIARCTSCGDIALIGNIINKGGNDYLVMQNSPFEMGNSDLNNCQYFHIVRKNNEDNEFVDFGEENEEINDNSNQSREMRLTSNKKSKIKGYWLCPHCGMIFSGETGKPKCGHPDADMIKLIEIDGKDKCLFCSEGNYSGFYIGSDGATSVLAMSLFESLPSKLCEINYQGATKRFNGGKQFLCFSDSRSEAAFFACYESRIYDSFISRRGLAQYIKSISSKIINNPAGYVNIVDLADGLAKKFEANHSFNEDLSMDDSSMGEANIAKNYAWMIVLDQLVGYNRKNYLQPMGYFQYIYRGITDEMVDYVYKKYLPSGDKNKIRDFLSVLGMSFARSGAINLKDLEIEDFYKKYVFKSTVQNCIIEQKSQGSGPHNQSWIPQNIEGKDDQWRRSSRQDLVKRVLKCNGKNANDFLLDIWRNFLTNPQHKFHAVPVGSYGGFAMPLEAFGVIVPGHKDAHWYKCDSCGKIFNYDIDGKCQVKNCEGNLLKIDNLDELYTDNYYKKAYDGTYLRKLLIKEHTAQLGRQKGSNYQDQFSSNKINALSCSTTFEMGVNLGQLETVFLRDMPPTAANYIQRAGRAGRSKESSAYALTYAKLSSHDFNYFNNPLLMIGGRIQPPVIKENNQKILYRHIFSVVLSYFFKAQENNCFFDSKQGKNTIGAFISTKDGISGYQRLVKMLNDKPEDLTNILRCSFGKTLEEKYKISSYGDGLSDGESWVEILIGESGRLSGPIKVLEENQKEMKDEVREIMKKAYDEDRVPDEREQRIILGLTNKSNFLLNKSIVDFLVESNVLPKYGFPVDTVELKHSSSNSELSLSRDMSQAISEYAPGCHIIADGRMYTPRYVAKVYRAGKIGFDDGYYCQCGDPNCQTTNFIYEDLPNQKCIGCGKTLQGINKRKAIQPSAGMIAEFQTEEVPSKKPERLYSSEASYVGTYNTNTKKLYKVGDQFITIISTENDKIMVNTDPDHPFYVCKKCGYALGRHDEAYKLVDGKEKKDTTETKKLKLGRAESITCIHRPSNGGTYCTETQLDKRIFIHNFNTDIVQILFNNKTFEIEDTAQGYLPISGISILHALLLSIADVLEIEQNDISGCLIKNISDELTNYRFVIFDNVPGGAGHVKRIVKDNGETLSKILKTAYSKMDCNCDSSCYKCLRTYQNQRYHAILSHKKVSDFLTNYLGDVTLGIISNSPVQHIIKFIFNGLSPSNLDQALDVCKNFMSENAFNCIKNIARDFPPNIENILYTISCNSFTAKALLKWDDKKILIIKNSDKDFYENFKNKSDWKIYIPDENFSCEDFKKEFGR